MTGQRGKHKNLSRAYVSRPPNPMTWKELKRALVRRFASERTAIEAMKALMRLEQLEEEDVIELGERLSRLAALGYADDQERERERPSRPN